MQQQLGGRVRENAPAAGPALLQQDPFDRAVGSHHDGVARFGRVGRRRCHFRRLKQLLHRQQRHRTHRGDGNASLFQRFDERSQIVAEDADPKRAVGGGDKVGDDILRGDGHLFLKPVKHRPAAVLGGQIVRADRGAQAGCRRNPQNHLASGAAHRAERLPNGFSRVGRGLGRGNLDRYGTAAARAVAEDEGRSFHGKQSGNARLL